VCPTGRLEWNALSAFGRTRFVVVSLVHAVALGFLGGMTTSLTAI